MDYKLEQQAEIETVYSRKNIHDLIKSDVNEDHPIVEHMATLIGEYRESVDSYYKSKQDRVKALKLTNKELAIEIFTVILPVLIVSPIQSLATLLGGKLGYSELLDGVKTAAELIAVTEPAKAFTIYHSTDELNDTGTLSVRSNFRLDDSTADLIARTKYLPPMICKPVNWITNTGGGYLQGSGSCILGRLNHHAENQSLDVLNILQDIPWQLNEMVDYIECPNKELDTHDKTVQFNMMRDQSTIVYQDLMKQGNQFYFVWKNDSRGRMYSQGYHLHLQSTQYKKAILDFFDEELIKDI